MKANILVPRIQRIIETSGFIGDGAELASSYAEAIKQVNLRLESVEELVAAKQISEAIRILEDEPVLIDEIAHLDFVQLGEWIQLCQRKGWTVPSLVDHTRLERILIVYNSAAAVEPVLKMYRKAMRTNNVPLAVQTLRRLVEVDKQRNWTNELLQSELSLQHQLANAFEQALLQKDDDEAERIATLLIEGKWSVQPNEKWVSEVKLYREKKLALAREKEQAEDISLLKKCLTAWAFEDVKALVEHLDLLVTHGTPIPEDFITTFNEIKRRLHDETEMRLQEAQWRSLCENLHLAVQMGDVTSVRQLLGSPDFLDRPPEEDLLLRAKRMLYTVEVKKRRKAMQIISAVMCLVLMIVFTIVYFVIEQNFEDKCERYAKELEAQSKRKNGIVLLEQSLKACKENDAELYNDARIKVFESRLVEMKKAEKTRREKLKSAFAQVEQQKEAQWGDELLVEELFKNVEALVKHEEEASRLRLLKMDYNKWCLQRAEDCKDAAALAGQALFDNGKALLQQLEDGNIVATFDADYERWENEYIQWNQSYAKSSPLFVAKLNEMRTSLDKRLEVVKTFNEVLMRLKQTTSLKTFFETRAILLSDYAAMKEVQKISKTLPIREDQYLDAIKEMLPQQKYLKELVSVKKRKTEAELRGYVNDYVMPIGKLPVYSGLYEVCIKGKDECQAYAIDRPKIESYSAGTTRQRVCGNIFDLKTQTFVDVFLPEPKTSKFEENFVKHISSKEFDDLISSAKDLTTVAKLKHFCYEKIEMHLKNAHKGHKKPFKKGAYSAYKRMQMVNIYISLLDELGAISKDSPFEKMKEEIALLAKSIDVEGITSALSWVLVDNPTIARRERECESKFLSLSSDIVTSQKQWEKAILKLKNVTDCYLAFVGFVDKKEGKKSISIHLSDEKDKPCHLFVLRNNNGNIVFKHAFVLRSDGVWQKAVHANDYEIGEPLFSFKKANTFVDIISFLKEFNNEKPANSLLKSVNQLFVY